MAEEKKKYRFLFIQPFELPKGGKHVDKYHSAELSKEQRLRMEYLNIGHLLEDVSERPRMAGGTAAKEERFLRDFYRRVRLVSSHLVALLSRTNATKRSTQGFASVFR